MSGRGRGSARTPTASTPRTRCAHVHESLGVIDVSTLGKLLVEGPDGGRAPRAPLPEPLRRHEARAHPLRRPHLGRAGRIMDDGTIARLADDLFYVTTTSTGADAVTAWFEWWNAVWGYDAEIVERDGRARRGQPRRAARRARRCSGSPRPTSPHEALQVPRRASRSTVAGVPTLALRIGFVGELGYELHFPSPAGEHLWDALVAEGARRRSASSRSGSSASRRATSSSARTRTRSRTSTRPAMPWLPKMDKDDFVGKFALEHFARPRRRRSSSSASRWRRTSLPAEGAQIVIEGCPAGRVTSARRSEARRPGDRPGVGADELGPSRERRVEIQVDRLRRGARIAHGAFFDPTGSGCDREPAPFSRRRAAAEGTTDVAAAARARGAADPAVVRDLSLRRASWRFAANVDAVTAGAGEELVRLSPRPGLPASPDDDPADVAERACAGGALAYDVDRRARRDRDRERAGHAAADRPRPRSRSRRRARSRT